MYIFTIKMHQTWLRIFLSIPPNSRRSRPWVGEVWIYVSGNGIKRVGITIPMINIQNYSSQKIHKIVYSVVFQIFIIICIFLCPCMCTCLYLHLYLCLFIFSLCTYIVYNLNIIMTPFDDNMFSKYNLAIENKKLRHNMKNLTLFCVSFTYYKK